METLIFLIIVTNYSHNTINIFTLFKESPLFLTKRQKENANGNTWNISASTVDYSTNHQSALRYFSLHSTNLTSLIITLLFLMAWLKLRETFRDLGYTAGAIDSL
jgi:hypothetical protein